MKYIIHRFMTPLAVSTICAIMTVPHLVSAKETDSAIISAAAPNETSSAGVKLLEEILSRIHNMPQLALSNNKQIIAQRMHAQIEANGYIQPPDPISCASPSGLKGLEQVMDKNKERFAQAGEDLCARLQSLDNMNELAGSQYVKNYNAPTMAKSALKSSGASQPGRLISLAPMIAEYQTNTKNPGAAATRSSARALGAAPSTIDLPANGPITFEADREFGGVQQQSPGFFQTVRQISPSQANTKPVSPTKSQKKALMGAAAETQEKVADQIAMLPPKILNGIPLLSLHASARQAENALTQRGGRITKEVLHTSFRDWSILSFSKSRGEKIALQLFIHNGLVEGMRIYDQAYLDASFNVHLGDDLLTLKNQFGDPAFILGGVSSNSAQPRIQNYVYPISQIAFQLSKSQKNMPPQVVSILIFNAK